MASAPHERIAEYDSYYYPPSSRRKPTDHIVFFGFYTHEVAKFIGIDRSLRSSLSWNPWRAYQNVRFELLHPNNSIKFRMRGEYEVEGAGELCKGIAKENENWLMSGFFLLSTWFDQLIALLCVLLLYVQFALRPLVESSFAVSEVGAQLVAWTLVCGGLGYGIVRHVRYLNLLNYSTTVPLLTMKVHLQPFVMIYIAYTGDWRLCLAHFAVWGILAFLFRQFHKPPISGRYMFGDCKYKHEYRPFWGRYLEAYAKVHETRRSDDLER